MKKEEEAAAARKQEELKLAAIAKEEEAARLKAEAEAKRKAEEEAARLKAEAEAKRKAEEESARLKAEEKKAMAAAAATAAAALALKKKEEEEIKLAAAKKAEEEAKPKDKEDDYLPCKAYQGHAVNDKINNVAFFKHDNGQFYFVLYDANGDVKLRSEGFRTSEERDQELSGVVRLHNDAKYYSKKEIGNHYMDILKDESGREVGRSCAKKVVTAAEIAAKKAEEQKVAKAAAAAAATAAAAMFWKREVRDNDFMHCNEYKGHQINDKQNKVAFFKKNGKFYFALYDNGGNVKLRSEAFDNVENRDSVLKAVLKNVNDKNRYFKREKDDYFWNVLKDNSGRVLAWSCAEKKKAAVVAPVAAVAATAAAATVATKTVVKEEKKGGFPWWLLALLGILLIGLLYWQGCFGCNTAKVVAPPPVPEVTHEEPAVQEPAVVEKSAEELEAEKAAEEARIIEERAILEREAAEQVTPAIGVEAGFDRVNERK